MSKFRLLIIAIMLVLTLVLAACQPAVPTVSQEEIDLAVQQTLAALPTATSTPTATATPTPTLTPTPVIVQFGPTNFPDNVNPLTGLEVADPEILNRRPIMVKVANFPRDGRPHAGLSQADIVFDYYTGEGSNRFMGLYYGQDASQIGPVRSAREVDRYLVEMYQGVLGAVYAWVGTWNNILDTLGWNRVISEGPNTCPAMCRDEELNKVKPEISVFANSAEMSKYYAARTGVTDGRQNLDGMAFHTIAPEGGVEALILTHQFGSNNLAKWIYDPETKKYAREIDNIRDSGLVEMIPLMDRVTGEQLQFSNVIVLLVHIEQLNKDDTLHEYDIVNQSGRALIFRDGKMYDVTYKSGYNTPIQFLDTAGNPFELQPGNTWIHLTGSFTSLTETAPGEFFTKNGVP
ncbi:MAG: DUF3048 domain-containing protein [Anaerolineaceae bacterium]|jgi:hypothetical protein